MQAWPDSARLSSKLLSYVDCHSSKLLSYVDCQAVSTRHCSETWLQDATERIELKLNNWMGFLPSIVKDKLGPLFQEKGLDFHCEYLQKIRDWTGTLPKFSSLWLALESACFSLQ